MADCNRSDPDASRNGLPPWPGNHGNATAQQGLDTMAKSPTARDEAARNEAADNASDPDTMTIPPIETVLPDMAAAATATTDAITDGMIADGTASTDDDGGSRVTRAFVMKNLLPLTPGQSELDWIMANVVAKGKGYHAQVGRVFGVARRAEPKQNKITRNGVEQVLDSIALHGLFQAERLDGQLQTFTLLYLPMAFAEQIAMALSIEGNEQAQFDVDIGLQATGKVISYEWTVTSYIKGAAERALRQMRGTRRIGQPAIRLSPAERLQIVS